MNLKRAIRTIKSDLFTEAGVDAEIIEWEGREALYVEETGFDAVEVSTLVSAPEGWFMEPVNSGLVAVWES